MSGTCEVMCVCVEVRHLELADDRMPLAGYTLMVLHTPVLLVLTSKY